MVKNMSDLDIILKFIILLKIVYIIKSKTNMIDQKGQSSGSSTGAFTYIFY